MKSEILWVMFLIPGGKETTMLVASTFVALMKARNSNENPRGTQFLPLEQNLSTTIIHCNELLRNSQRGNV